MSGKRPAFGSLRTGAFAARALVAATRSDGGRSLVLDSMTPRPIPGER